jgi:exodeoxyribonuclease-3
VKIATWNVNGIRARKAEVQAFIEEEHPDVVCLQELKAAPEQIPADLLALDGYHCYWHGQKGYSGVGLHVRTGLVTSRPSFSHPSFDYEHRIVVADLGTLEVASVYVPNGGKDFAAKMRFLEAMVTWARDLRETGKSVVVLGDLNVTRAEIDVHPSERKATAIGQLPEERALFARVLGQDLDDVARRLDPDNDHLFTWWAPWRNMRQRDIGWRLDYVLASPRVGSRATACRAYRERGTSDHAPVIATFDI